jgi:hypothetical protein
MYALSTLVIFFFVLIGIYTAAAAMVNLYGWIRKRRALQNKLCGETIEQIDQIKDRLKDRLFFISVLWAFFIIAPFLLVLMLFNR